MVTSAASRPRLLMRQLREVMAEPVDPQMRLDNTVKVIAANMVAEVCSLYLKRGADSLELYATEGLNIEAVHNTVLHLGEGLVGLVAQRVQAINLSDAPSHPKFAYRPETGEDPFHSFLGVPIVRTGRLLGVLVVQNQTTRHYDEEEVEALQNIAMILAEVVASGELIDPELIDGDGGQAKGSARLEGTALASGIAMGHVVLHEPRVEVSRLIADDADVELDRLNRGLSELTTWIDRMLSTAEFAAKGEHREVLEAYRMFAHDRGWIQRMRDAVASGLSAEAAVERVHYDMRAQLLSIGDAFWRERAHDFDDLSNRLLRHLVGRGVTAAGEELPKDTILCARTMGPAELLDYDRPNIRGLVLEEGGPTSHVAIVARAVGVPLIGRASGLLVEVNPGDEIIADGDSGEVYVRPQSDVVEAYAAKVQFSARRQARYAAIRDEPAVTRDGHRIELLINAGLDVDLPHLKESGADGIGLFRTELQFMVSAQFPRLNVQKRLYGSVFEVAGSKPVVFRTLDLGGDKILPYLAHDREENPAMGWRAIRFALDRPALLRYQIRALLMAAAGQSLSIMFPFIAEVSEFKAARELVDQEADLLRQRGQEMPEKISVGTMLEVPSLAWQLEALCPIVDFVSVGSNDLFQFMFASDRANPKLTERYDPLNPPMLRFLSHTADICRQFDVPLSLCGEMAGRPLDAMALIGLGFRRISMPPAAVGPVKMMMRSLNVSLIEPVIKDLLTLPDHSVREHLEAFARKNDVVF